MHRRLLWVALAYFGLAGFNTSNLYAPERAKPDLKPGYGRVIVSTGATKTCLWSPMNLVILPAGERPWTFRTALMIDQKLQKSDFDDHPGYLNAVTLKAGDYQIFASYVSIEETSSTPRYVFTVTPGETVYLGEYWLSESCDVPGLGEFRDQTERDLAMFKARNPALGSLTIVTRLPVLSGTRYGG